jgi:hypothetical protein
MVVRVMGGVGVRMVGVMGGVVGTVLMLLLMQKMLQGGGGGRGTARETVKHMRGRDMLGVPLTRLMAAAAAADTLAVVVMGTRAQGVIGRHWVMAQRCLGSSRCSSSMLMVTPSTSRQQEKQQGLQHLMNASSCCRSRMLIKMPTAHLQQQERARVRRTG